MEQADIVDPSSFPTTKANSNYAVGHNGYYYFSGYYYENNAYYVYHMKEIENGSDPFVGKEEQIINSNNQLYGYYQRLNGMIK